MFFADLARRFRDLSEPYQSGAHARCSRRVLLTYRRDLTCGFAVQRCPVKLKGESEVDGTQRQADR